MSWFKKKREKNFPKKRDTDIPNYSKVLLRMRFKNLERFYFGLIASHAAVKKYGTQIRPNEAIINKQLYALISVMDNASSSFSWINLFTNEEYMILSRAEQMISLFVGQMFRIQYNVDWTLTDEDYFKKMREQDWDEFEARVAAGKHFLEVLLSGVLNPEPLEISAGTAD